MKKFIIFLLAALCLSLVVMISFAGGLVDLPSFIRTANPLLFVSLWALGFALTAFIFGMITKDYSWVDRIWSILPVGFAWYYAYRGGFTLILCLVAVLITLWGARLTFNFARKGGYAGHEDYRWSILRGQIKNPLLWQLFSLFFISFFQVGLFILFTWPVANMAMNPVAGPSALFWFFIALGVAFICFETTADQQQWNFHAAKNAAKNSTVVQPASQPKYSADIKNGFLAQGLFAVSRHPNYFGELGFWWMIWLSALSLTQNIISTGIFGPIILTVMFIGSTVFTESITSGKYPAYQEYKRRVSPIIPWFRHRP
ncbi:MAG: DUF1295 domain-containing protein [Coriobacteriia bacterium]|nr:DUF1295 domain-containing protein [Coriobacteriia bacterium]